jgi:hypothetical protein
MSKSARSGAERGENVALPKKIGVSAKRHPASGPGSSAFPFLPVSVRGV